MAIKKFEAYVILLLKLDEPPNGIKKGNGMKTAAVYFSNLNINTYFEISPIPSVRVVNSGSSMYAIP